MQSAGREAEPANSAAGRSWGTTRGRTSAGRLPRSARLLTWLTGLPGSAGLPQLPDLTRRALAAQPTWERAGGRPRCSASRCGCAGRSGARYCTARRRRSRRTGALVRAAWRSDPVHGVAFVVGLAVGFAVGPGVGEGFVVALAVGLVLGLALGLVLGLALGLVLGLPEADGLPFADGDTSGDVEALADVDAFGEPEGDGDTDADGDADGDALGLVDADACGVGDGFGAGGGGGRKAFVAAPSTAPSDVRLKTGFGAATMPKATARAANACGAPSSATD